MTHCLPTFLSSSQGIDRDADWKGRDFCYCLESLQSCCAAARAAACAGRYSAAHDLFQNALVFFDRASDANRDATDSLHFWEHSRQLSQARRELNQTAAMVYTDEVACEIRACSALAGGKTA